MRIDVIADAEGNVVGTMVVRPGTPEGHISAIFPAIEEHSLHHLEVSDDFASLPADELHIRLRAHLAGPSSI